MKEEKYKCPICSISHSYSSDNLNISNYNDEKLLCSSCINKLLSKDNNNNLVFPNVFIDNNIKLTDSKNEKKNNELIKHQTINESIIEEIKQQSNNKILIEELKQQFNNTKSIINGIKPKPNCLSDTTTKNNSKNNSKNKNKNKNNNYYSIKTPKANKISDKDFNENSICEMHLLPMNIICIDEKEKICRQCALSKNHLNHKIITEKDYYKNIDELTNIYNDIKMNINKYSNINNNNNNNDFHVIEEIDNTLLDTEKNLIELKSKIIKNINEHFNTILNYIDLRRKEIFDKYHYTNYDISNLNQSSQNWMNIVLEKLPENDTKNDNYKTINYTFLENGENKNVFNLINSGKQLNERYNFFKDIQIVIDKLKLYKDNGIKIKQNNDIINNIINNDNKIIHIEDNQDLIKSLNLSPYESLLQKSKTNRNKKISNMRANANNEIELEKKNNKSSITDKNDKTNYSLSKEDIECIESKSNKKQRIYFRKIISDMDRANHTENNFHKARGYRRIYGNQNNIPINTTGPGTKTNSKNNSKRNILSLRQKNKNKEENNINKVSYSQSTFPLLHKINKINNNIKKLLRNNTSNNINGNKNKRGNKKNELIHLNNLKNFHENKNININFNGDIINYNSDSNISINISNSNSKKKNKKKSQNKKNIKNNNDKINNILQLLTPKKKE